MTGSYPGQRTQAPEAPDWRGAACRGWEPDLWFPEAGANRTAIKLAKAICNTCPIQRTCFDYAIQFDVRDLPGIWGGLTGPERHKHRRDHSLLRRTHVVNHEE